MCVCVFSARCRLDGLARLERKSRFVRPLLLFTFTVETVARYTINNLDTVSNGIYGIYGI